MKKKSGLLLIFFLICITYFIWFFYFKPIQISSAFYFWETERNDFSDYEKETLKSTDTKKLYVKFFEVENDATFGIIPTEKTNLFTKTKGLNLEIIPTIYIRNEVFKTIKSTRLTELAENINFLINKKFNENFTNSKKSFQEIQIDCDWTESSKKNYFIFLKALKKISSKQISATLRLYAYKFPAKMGVLPVDRAMLMCYNLISPPEAKNKNSILDLNELKKYLIGSDVYPIPLDIALPIYSSIQLYKNNHLAGIFYNETAQFVQNLRKEKKYWYRIINDTVINDIFLRKNDIVKFEKCTFKELMKAIEIVNENVTFSTTTTIVLYNLQETELKQYKNEELLNLFHSIHR